MEEAEGRRRPGATIVPDRERLGLPRRRHRADVVEEHEAVAGGWHAGVEVARVVFIGCSGGHAREGGRLAHGGRQRVEGQHSEAVLSLADERSSWLRSANERNGRTGQRSALLAMFGDINRQHSPMVWLLTYLLVISLTWHTTIASTLPRRSAPLSRGGALTPHRGFGI